MPGIPALSELLLLLLPPLPVHPPGHAQTEVSVKLCTKSINA